MTMENDELNASQSRSPVWVVTVANREPYLAMAAKLEDVVRSLGHTFYIHRDVGEDTPWQAKRHAVRHAVAKGAGTVYHIDADCEVLDQSVLAGLLIPRTLGIYTQVVSLRDRLIPGIYWRDLPPGLAERFVARTDCYAYWLRRLGLKDSWRLSDWFVGYSLPPSIANSLLDCWDEIASDLMTKQITWGDNVSIGLAARALGVPVKAEFPVAEVERSLHHLRNGQANGYYVLPTQRP